MLVAFHQIDTISGILDNHDRINGTKKEGAYRLQYPLLP